jgi:hypothetical protein
MGSSARKVGRSLGTVVVLALAMMGVTVASAAATLPEFEYTLPDSIAVSGGQMVVESASESLHSAVTCTGTSGTAEITGGHKEFALISLRFKGCTTKFGGILTVKCTSAGLSEGEITTTKSLTTRLEYLSKASHEVGLIFNYGGKTSTVASFSCGGMPGVMRGEFIAKMTPVNVLATEFSLVLKGTKGTPEYTQFENESGGKTTVSPLEIGFSEKFEKANLNATGLALKLSKQARIQA